MINGFEFLGLAGSALTGSGSVFQLPNTGGSGPLIVTVIGISLAGLSLLLLLLRGKPEDKPKGKQKR